MKIKEAKETIKRQANAIEIAKDYIDGRKGVCNICNAMDTLEEIEKALNGQ